LVAEPSPRIVIGSPRAPGHGHRHDPLRRLKILAIDPEKAWGQEYFKIKLSPQKDAKRAKKYAVKP
jgi:hypothetical protein